MIAKAESADLLEYEPAAAPVFYHLPLRMHPPLLLGILPELDVVDLSQLQGHKNRSFKTRILFGGF
jgi:hypothetical protein